MKTIYAVAAYDQYYPQADNVIKVFSSKEAAYEFLEYIKVSKAVYFDHFDVFQYNVIDDDIELMETRQ